MYTKCHGIMMISFLIAYSFFQFAIELLARRKLLFQRYYFSLPIFTGGIK